MFIKPARFFLGVVIAHIFFGIILSQSNTTAQPVSQQGQPELNFSEPLKNLGSIINTTSDEFAPAVAPDASSIIFNSKRNSKYQDLYITYFDFEKDTWGKPLPMSSINSPYNDEAPALSRDGQTLFFSSDRDGSLEMPKNQLGQIKISFDIYFSQKKEGAWSPPQRIPGAINTIHHEKAPSINHDDTVLYYTIWRFGDIQNTAIMRAQLKNGVFVNPKPLPQPINAGYQELALIESANGDGFYFSSLRPGGFGGWDIYYVSAKKGLLGQAINLGSKINSKKNDAFLSRVDQLFFISSDRDGGKGRFDIYSTFIFEDDKHFKTRMIHFDFNSAKIKKNSYKYLNALAHFLGSKPKFKMEIVGHTDLHGSDKSNLQLSKNRAKSVKGYLLKQGIDSKRLKIQGLGRTQPLINKIGHEFDRQNRRIEFYITN